MNQRQLNREVSRKTGESVATISARGFVALTGQPYERDPEDLIVDWDALDRERSLSVMSGRKRTAFAV